MYTMLNTQYKKASMDVRKHMLLSYLVDWMEIHQG